MRAVLGIDGGGTSTRCMVADENLNILGYGVAGSSNYRKISIEKVKENLSEAITQSLRHLRNVKIETICLGLAGVDSETDKSRILNIFLQIIKKFRNSNNKSLVWNVNPDDIILTNDAVIALAGGIEENIGIVVIVGTGAIVYGRNKDGMTARVDGWGYLLGDRGSAYYIAINALRKIIKNYDIENTTDELYNILLRHYNIKSLYELKDVIYNDASPAERIASFAIIVDSMASKGDVLAQRIIFNAGKELIKSTLALKKMLFKYQSNVKVITSGSVWKSLSGLRSFYIEGLRKKTNSLIVCEPLNEPVFGAIKLALNRLHNRNIFFNLV